MTEPFAGDVHAGITQLDLNSIEAFDLSEGVTIGKTYSHLMAHFIMAFSPATLNKPHPGPWKAATGGAGYTSDITVDLHVPSALHDRFTIATTIEFLIQLSINPAANITAFASHAFSALKEVPDDQSKIIPLDVPQRHFPLTSSDTEVTLVKLNWIKQHWRNTYTLRSDHSEFALALAALNTCQFIHNTALILVSAWGALEALFSPSTSELKFRVSALIASYLEAPGQGRLDLQKSVGKLYDKRSAAAHGKPSHNADDVMATLNLLHRIVTAMIEANHVPTRDELEQRLFGV